LLCILFPHRHYNHINNNMAVIQEAYISEEIHELKAQANRHFAAKDYDAALSGYLDILALLPPRPKPKQESSEEEQDDGQGEAEEAPIGETSPETATQESQESEEAGESEEMQQIRQFRSVIYANIAATHLRLSQPRDAVKAATESLLDQPRYVKALYRRAQANEEIATWSGLSAALEDHQTLLSCPDLPSATRPDVQAAIARLEPKAKQAAEREKDEMISKLKGLGDSILGNFGLSTNNFKFTQQPGGGYSMNFVR
jgi:hypothetical protein